MSYSKILPAPGTLINGAGLADPNGFPAPGFAGLNFRSQYLVDLKRTRSNRGLPVDQGQHYWAFSIKYHEMTQASYEAISNFLYGHNTRKNPFFVVLPNMNKPKNANFEAFARANTIRTFSDSFAGDTTVTITSVNENLQPGCFINFIDSEDALHKSVYRVARVETSTNFSGSQPSNGTLRLTIFPPLQREFSGNVEVRFIDPLFRVLQTNQINPDYNEDNLVSLGIDVEEILP